MVKQIKCIKDVYYCNHIVIPTGAMCSIREWLNGGFTVMPIGEYGVIMSFAYSVGNVWPYAFEHFKEEELLLLFIAGDHAPRS